MPPLPPHAGLVKIEIFWGLPSGGFSTTGLHWAYTGSVPTAAAANAIAASVRTAAVTQFLPRLTTDRTLQNVTVTDLSSSSGVVGLAAASSGGARPTPGLSVNDATVVDYTIGRRYRGGKPRSYYPFGANADQTGGNLWTSAYLTEINNAVTAFTTAVVGVNSGGTILSTPVSVSYYSGFTTYTGSGGRPKTRATLRATPLLDPITAHSVRRTIGSQRRRLGI